ncbi:MAG: hypothetical protein Q9220_005212 [cf. Caloplaca sp. 1 TL-2023]
MKYIVALAALSAAVSAQTPPGCSTNSGGTFVIQPKNITDSPTQFDKRQVKTICGSTPIVTLTNGVLKDQNGRTGEVVANAQFQFDNPLQSGAIFTDGFSICQNSSLAVGGSTIFYQCLSGTFYNLYQASQGKQCNAVYINTIACESSGSTSASIGSSSSASTTSMMTSSAAAPATPATTMTTPAPAPAPAPSAPAAVPYPVSNTTAPAPSGTGSTTPAPSPFVPGSGATTLIVGGNLVALVAAIGAFALF